MTTPPAARSSGIGADGTWTPAFPGQRRPFPRGNSYSTVSGVSSEKVIGPLVAELMEKMLTDPCPKYLAHPILRGLVEEYCRARAKQQLQEQVLNAIGWPHFADYDDEVQQPPFHMPLWQRREAARKAWNRAWTRVHSLSDKLGLNPMAQVTAPADALWRKAAAECGELEWPRPPLPPR